jgi:hypothetical protein
VERKIYRLIDILDGPHGGYAMAATNSIMPETPLANIEAMVRTAPSYGSMKRPSDAKEAAWLPTTADPAEDGQGPQTGPGS